MSRRGIFARARWPLCALAVLTAGGAAVAMSDGVGAKVRLSIVKAIGSPSQLPRGQQETAESFADSIGVVVHLVYADSSYANWPKVDEALRFIGVRRLREIAPLPTNARVENVRAAAAAGYTFTFLALGSVPLDQTMKALSVFERKYPGSVAAVEGPNEVNNFGFSYKGMSGDKAAQAFQSDLYQQVKHSSQLKNVPVYNLTSWPDLAGQADYGNFHSYAHAGAQAQPTLLGDLARQQAVMPGRPMVLTEAGYHNTIAAGLWEGVDEATAGPMVLNLLFDSWAAGVSQTILYQLLDGYPDPSGKDMERHFGLFDVNYRPKPAAVGLRNLLRTLRKTGAKGEQLGPGAVLDGVEDLATLQLSRADGARIVIVYRRARIWDPYGHGPVKLDPVQVTLRAPSGSGTAQLHDPLTGKMRPLDVVADRIRFQQGANPSVLVFQRDAGHRGQ